MKARNTRASSSEDRLTLISCSKLAKVITSSLHVSVQKGIEILAPDGVAIDDLSEAEDEI